MWPRPIDSSGLWRTPIASYNALTFIIMSFLVSQKHPTEKTKFQNKWQHWGHVTWLRSPNCWRVWRSQWGVRLDKFLKRWNFSLWNNSDFNFFQKFSRNLTVCNSAPKSRDQRPQKLVCLKAYKITHRMQQLLFSYRIWFSSDTHLKNQKNFLFGNTGPKSRDWRPKIYLHFEDLIVI